MAEPVRRAAELLNLDDKWLQEFDAEDPFNGNRLEGFLCRKPDHRYGALAIQFRRQRNSESLLRQSCTTHLISRGRLISQLSVRSPFTKS